MKFIDRLKILSSNMRIAMTTNLLLPGRESSNIAPIMDDQIGAGWVDRLFAVRGRLSPDTVERIVNEASSRTLGKLGPLYEIMLYIEQDPRIGGMIDKRVGAASRSNWMVKPGNRDNTQSLEAARFLEKYIEDIRFKSFLKSIMEGRKYGVTAFQNVVVDVGDKYVFQDPTDEGIQISQSRWYQEAKNENSEWGRLYLKTRDGEKRYLHRDDHISAEQLSIFIDQRKRGFYDMTGFMGRVVRYYPAKIWTLLFFAQAVERFGKPFVYSILSEKHFNDPAFKSKVSTVLKNFGAERWGVFPEGFSMAFLNTQTAVSTDMHITFLNWLNTEMAIAILGQNLSTEVSGGSFAAAITHAAVEDQIVEDDIDWMAEQLNDQFVYWLVRINFPALDPDDYPALVLSQVKNIDVEKTARGLKAASELIDIPESEVYAALQIRNPIVKEGVDPAASGADRYDERVVGPDARRATRADSLLRSLGAS